MEAQDEPGQAKPFLDHLDDLRATIIRCLLAVALGMLVALPFFPHFIAWLQAPLLQASNDADMVLRTLEVSGAFSVIIRVVFWCGLLLSAPFVVFFVGGFIFPALMPRERRMVYRAVAPALLLFALGVALAYYGTLPVALNLMYSLNEKIGTIPDWTINSYITFSVHLLLGFGLAFQMPIVVLILGYMEVLSAATLREKRPYVIVCLFVLAMILTPPDIITQVMMAVPMWLLYEVSTWLIHLKERRDAESAAAG